MNLLEKAKIITTATAYDNGKLHSVKGGEVADFDVVRGSLATRVNAEGLIEDINLLSGELVSDGSFDTEGVEIITNGSFDDASAWSISGDWEIVNGAAEIQESTTSFLVQSNIVDLSVKTYKLQYEVVTTNGSNLRLAGGNSAFGSPTLDTATIGVKTAFLTSNGIKGNLQFNQNAFRGSIDNISLKEVAADWDLGTGWSVSDGKATSSLSGLLQQSTSELTAGKTYKTSFEITEYTSGGVKLYSGSGSDTPSYQTSLGTHVVYFVANGNTTSLYSNSFIGSIDNISVVEIIDATNIPRIDYTTGEGVVLLEPQSTNLVTQSELLNSSLSYKVDTTITDNYGVSPSGQSNSSRIQFADATSFCYGAISISTTHTASVYVKGTSGETIRFGIGGNITTGDLFTFNGLWQRIEYTTASAVQIFLSSYGGATATDFEAFGLQLEALPYATSYIPTSGAIATRLADSVTGAGDATTFNSSEGVLYAEMAALADDLTDRYITISDGGLSNRVSLRFSGSNEIRTFVQVGGSFVSAMSKVIGNILTQNKIALKWSENNFSLWVNGVEAATDTSGAIFPTNTLNRLSFDSGNAGNDFLGKVKALAVFNEALTDSELECLTTI